MKIIREKNGYLLSDLLEDLKDICEDNGSENVLPHTSTLKKRLAKEFPEELGFYPVGRYVIVHSSDMNPCDYTVCHTQG